MNTAPLKTCKGLWFPISELHDIHHQPLMLASPKLIDLDFNPDGVSTGYWQDEQGWIVNGWDSNGDEPTKVILDKDDVTHFMYIEGPFSSTLKIPADTTEKYLQDIAQAISDVRSGKADVLIIDSFASHPQIAEAKARKLCADKGYVYFDGSDYRPDNWDRKYILRRSGMEDGTKSSSEFWKWTSRDSLTEHDIIGYQSDPPQRSADMTLQGLWSWYYDDNRGFVIDLIGVKDGQQEWLVEFQGSHSTFKGDLLPLLCRIRNLWVCQDGYEEGVATELKNGLDKYTQEYVDHE